MRMAVEKPRCKLMSEFLGKGGSVIISMYVTSELLITDQEYV